MNYNLNFEFNKYHLSTNSFGYNLVYLSFIGPETFTDTTGQAFYRGELPSLDFNGIFDIKYYLNQCSIGVSYFG